MEDKTYVKYFVIGFIVFILVLFVFQRPQISEKNIVTNQIIYIDRNITITENCIIPITIYYEYNYTGKLSKELELIRRIRNLEKQQDKFINHSDIFDDYNQTQIELNTCEDTMCNWNSSWC